MKQGKIGQNRLRGWEMGAELQKGVGLRAAGTLFNLVGWVEEAHQGTEQNTHLQAFPP